MFTFFKRLFGKQKVDIKPEKNQMDKNEEKTIVESEDSKELDALYELHDFWEDDDIVREHHGLTIDKAMTNFKTIETSLKNLVDLQKNVKLYIEVFYDELGDCDRAAYYVRCSKEPYRKQYISMGLFKLLEPILGVSFENPQEDLENGRKNS